MLLAIDTSGPFCSAALFDLTTSQFVFSRQDELGRGHAEHLMAMLEEEFQRTGTNWSELSRLAVVHGPGSFTGLRVGIAAARGFALALKIPCNTVSVFDALSHHHAIGNLACVLDARRGQVWMQCFDGQGKPLESPAAFAVETIAEAIPDSIKNIAGSGSALLQSADEARFNILDACKAPPIEAVALFAANTAAASHPPKPLYLREPDAKPQTTAPTQSGSGQ